MSEQHDWPWTCCLCGRQCEHGKHACPECTEHYIKEWEFRVKSEEDARLREIEPLAERVAEIVLERMKLKSDQHKCQTCGVTLSRECQTCKRLWES